MSAVSAVLGLLAVFVLTAGTGYFVAQEFAYVAADRLALAREAEAGDKKAARALKVLERLSFMLSGAQLGITVTGLVVGFIAEPSVSALLKPALTGIGSPTAPSAASRSCWPSSLATVVQMVLGELAPKNLAIAVPERLAKSLAASTLAYLKVVGPLVHALRRRGQPAAAQGGHRAGRGTAPRRHPGGARPSDRRVPRAGRTAPATPPNCSTTPWSSPSAPWTR